MPFKKKSAIDARAEETASDASDLGQRSQETKADNNAVTGAGETSVNADRLDSRQDYGTNGSDNDVSSVDVGSGGNEAEDLGSALSEQQTGEH